MSIYTGLEATIRILRVVITRQNSEADTMREALGSLHQQNDQLSDRIHLDLDPRIAALVKQVAALKEDKTKLIHELDQDEEIFETQRTEMTRLRARLADRDRIVAFQDTQLEKIREIV